MTIAGLYKFFDLAGRCFFQVVPADEVGGHMMLRLPGTAGIQRFGSTIYTVDGSHVSIFTKMQSCNGKKDSRDRRESVCGRP